MSEFKPSDVKIEQYATTATESECKLMVRGRAKRLSHLVELGAPNFIIANEYLMLTEALLAMFRHSAFDPTKDDRVFSNRTNMDVN